MSDSGARGSGDSGGPDAGRSLALHGGRCREARERRGFSRPGLAELSRRPGGEPLSEATIKRAESGQPIYFDKARRLAELLQVPLRSLLLEPALELDTGPNMAPAIAVLPLQADSEAQRHFADGLAEDLTIRLGNSFFPVIARGSSFRFREPNPDYRLLRDELAARYVISGSVRREGERVRVAAELTDTESGLQLWGDIFEASDAGVFELQDRLSGSIARRVGRAVFNRESARVLRRDPSDLMAWELSLRGAWHFHAGSEHDNQVARGFLRRALEQEAFLPLAWYCLALTHQRELIYQWGGDPQAALAELTACCVEFDRIFPDDPLAHVAAAYGCIYRGDRQSAMSRLAEAIALDPNSVAGRSLYGQTLAMAKEPDRGIAQLELALRLSPKDPELASFFLALALCHFAAERYTEAIHWAQCSLAARPNVAFCHGTIGSAHAHLGDLAAARQAVSHMAKLGPQMSARGYRAIIASTDPEIAGRYLHGLKLAGFAVP